MPASRFSHDAIGQTDLPFALRGGRSGRVDSCAPAVLEPDPVARVSTPHTGPPGVGESEHAMQILMTEHWSLLASRGFVYTEAMSRATIFIAALSGSVVALALVAQATDFGSGFIAFALVLLPVDFFLGFVTVLRLMQVTVEDTTWVQGMNRIRHAYFELAPELEPYFVTSRYDDDPGILLSTLGRRKPVGPGQAFLSIPGLVAVVSSVVLGAIVGIGGLGLGLETLGCLLVGGAGLVLGVGVFLALGYRMFQAHLSQIEVRFPSPHGEI
jgi:hypothetical protein